jgi:hypothetical protein
VHPNSAWVEKLVDRFVDQTAGLKINKNMTFRLDQETGRRSLPTVSGKTLHLSADLPATAPEIVEFPPDFLHPVAAALRRQGKFPIEFRGEIRGFPPLAGFSRLYHHGDHSSLRVWWVSDASPVAPDWA